jgi:putative DNA primase/helicase
VDKKVSKNSYLGNLPGIKRNLETGRSCFLFLNHPQRPAPEDPFARFAAAMRAEGYQPGPIADNRLVRCPGPGDKPGRKNGWYRFHSDFPASGQFGSWKTGKTARWCCKARLTPAENAIVSQRAEENRLWQAEESARLRPQIEENIRQRWEQARAASPDHPYLRRKQVLPHSLRQEGGLLLIPFRNASGQLKTLQSIDSNLENNRKLFHGGGEKKGNFFSLGPWPPLPGQEVVIAEGFATAASIQQATGLSCVMAGDAGNLEPAARAIKQAWPEARIILAADNDCSSPGNPGKTRAEAAAKAVGGRVVVPEPLAGGKSADWNDAALCLGLEEVKRQICGEKDEGLQSGRPLNLEWPRYSGSNYLLNLPDPLQYLIRKVMLRGSLGLLAGPPGSSKGQFCIQLAVQLAAGLPAFGEWEPLEPLKVVFISAEDIQQVIHWRFFDACVSLPKEMLNLAASNFYGIPVHGVTALCQAGKNSTIEITRNFMDLKKIIAESEAKLVILDTLSRFFAIEENDNAAMTQACGALEELAKEHDCAILLIHHTNKTSGDLVNNEAALNAALNQTALRGASALAGAVRVIINCAPLGADLAGKIIDEEAAREARPGKYLAVAISKNNYGPISQRLFFRRDRHGFLVKVQGGRDKGDSLIDNARKLADEVARRESRGEEPLLKSTAGQEAFGWGIGKNQKAVDKALEEGWVKFKKKNRGNGFILCPGKPGAFSGIPALGQGAGQSSEDNENN